MSRYGGDEVIRNVAREIPFNKKNTLKALRFFGPCIVLLLVSWSFMPKDYSEFSEDGTILIVDRTEEFFGETNTFEFECEIPNDSTSCNYQPKESFWGYLLPTSMLGMFVGYIILLVRPTIFGLSDFEYSKRVLIDKREYEEIKKAQKTK